MKTRDSSPSVHVHVPETTSVHVHRRRSQQIPKGPSKAITSGSHTDTHMSPLSKVDAEVRCGRFEKHGRTIDRLMMDVGPPTSIKSELKLQKKECRLQPQSECASAHQDDGEVQEEVEASKNLNIREEENVIHSSKKKGLNRLERGAQHGDTDLLLRTLVEAEIDGVAVANQLTAMKETTDSLTKEKRLSKTGAASVRRQQESLVRKIEIFDSTNRVLRDLLRKRHEYEKTSLMSSEQKEVLIRRLADSEAEKIRLLAKLNNKEKEATKLGEHLDSEKDNVKTTGELSTILELTCNQLESQLLRKEAEKEHLVAQIQRMEQSHDQQRAEIRALEEELQKRRQQSKEDRERQGLEIVTLLTQQAELAEESARQLSAQLQEKETQLAEALSTSEDWCARHSGEVAAKSRLEEEIAAVKNQMTELTALLHAVEEKGRAEREELIDQLHSWSTENASTKLENQRLKASLTSSEETLKELQSEALQLKTSIRKHESLVDRYKSKVQQARLESEDYCLKLEITQRETRKVKANLEMESEQVRRQLLGRLRELEHLPEKLRRTELQLREAQEEAHTQERRGTEQNDALSEFRHKVEQQGAWLDTFQHKNVLLQEENNLLNDTMESLERKLEKITFENQEIVHVITTKEATIHSIQRQLEERASECDVLSKQLAQALEDTQRQVDDNVQRALSKERTFHFKALDLESQLGIAKTELAQLRRGKEEMERRFQGQLKNMKERLEQSDSTNRSLHNYANFLKSSYSNMWGDDSLLAS